MQSRSIFILAIVCLCTMLNCSKKQHQKNVPPPRAALPIAAKPKQPTTNSTTRLASPTPTAHKPHTRQRRKKRKPSERDIKRAIKEEIDALGIKINGQLRKDLNGDKIPEIVLIGSDTTGSFWAIYQLSDNTTYWDLAELERGGCDDVSFDRIAGLGLNVFVAEHHCCMQENVTLYAFVGGRFGKVFLDGVEAECREAYLTIERESVKGPKGKPIYGISKLEGLDCQDLGAIKKKVRIDVVKRVKKKLGLSSMPAR